MMTTTDTRTKTSNTQPTHDRQWNETIDWDDVEREKAYQNSLHNKNQANDDDEEDVDFDEKSAREERREDPSI